MNVRYTARWRATNVGARRVKMAQIAVVAALFAFLVACDAPVPPELEADAPAVEVPAIPPQFTSSVEPTLAVEVTPEKIYVSTHFLHGTWRDHLREEFEAKRADEHWFAAREWSGELIERLDDTVPTWRSGRVEVADLEDGRFTEKSMKSGSSAIVPPLFDVLSEQTSVVRRVGAGLGIVRMMMDGPLELYPSSLLLVVHPDVPPRTVERVIYTASQVEIEQFQLVVNAEQPRMVPLRHLRGVVGPPSSEREPIDVCAMAHVSRTGGLYLAFDQVMRDYDEALSELYDDGRLLYSVGSRYPQDTAGDTWASSPLWDDALVVEAANDCRSAAFEDIPRAKQRLERLIDAFDAAPVCRNAFFELPSMGSAESPNASDLRYQEQVEALAALAGVSRIERVYVGAGSDGRIAADLATDCSRTYFVEPSD